MISLEIFMIVGLIALSVLLFFVSNNRRMELLFVFYLIFTIIFPKAGIKIGEAPILIGNLMLIYVFAVFFIRQAMEKQPMRYGKMGSFLKIYLVFSALYFVSILILSFWDQGVIPSMMSFIPNIVPIYTAFIVYHLYFQRPESLTKHFIISFSIVVIYGLFQYVFGHYQTVLPGLTVNYSDYAEGQIFESKNNLTAVGLKLVSTYQNGNLFGYILNVGIIILIGQMFYLRFNKIRNKKKKLIILLCLAFVCLVLTLSRSAMVGMFAGLFIFALFFSRLRKYLLLSCVAFLVLVFAFDLDQRIFAADFTAAGRTVQYFNYINAAIQSDSFTLFRLFTMGLGFGFNEVFFNGFILTRVESAILNLIIYTGVIGFLLYLFPLVYALVKIIGLKRSIDKGRYIRIIALFSSLMGAWAQMSIDQLLNLPPIGFIYWLIVGWLFIEIQKYREKSIVL